MAYPTMSSYDDQRHAYVGGNRERKEAVLLQGITQSGSRAVARHVVGAALIAERKA